MKESYCHFKFHVMYCLKGNKFSHIFSHISHKACNPGEHIMSDTTVNFISAHD